MDVIADAFPVSSEEVHIDPYVDATTIGVTALVAALSLWLLFRRQFRAAIFPVAVMGGAVLLSSLAKAAVERPAIEGGGSDSFPSGTATWSMATVAAVVLLASRLRWQKPALLVGAVFVAGLGAVIAWEEWHYPSDIVAGWCLALAWATGLWLALRRPRLGLGVRAIDVLRDLQDDPAGGRGNTAESA